MARLSWRQKSLAEKIFDWTLCARRPLKFDELKDAVAVDLHDASWDRRKISAETDEKRFLHVCGNLVVFHERDGTVRFAHHTVGKFLEQHKADRSQTDAKIGSVCLTYLGFSDFTTLVISGQAKQEILKTDASRQAGFYRIPQVLGLNNFFYDFVLGLYNRNNKLSLPDVNYDELARRYQKKPLPGSLSRKYYLLDYITANWIWHTKSFDPTSTEVWRRFEDFVFHKVLPFDFKPWVTLEKSSSLPHLAPYLWALENNHLPLLLLLRDQPEPRSLKFYLEYKTLCRDRIPSHMPGLIPKSLAINFRSHPDLYDWPVMKVLLEGTTAVRELCLQADPSIVSYQHIMTRALRDANLGLIISLLRSGAKLQKNKIEASNVLCEASRRGNQDLVNMLLNSGADANSRIYQDKRGWTPLYHVVMSEIYINGGHRQIDTEHATSCSPLEMIQLLLDRGADPNAKYARGDTVLHKAIHLGENYVRLLVSGGADVNTWNEQQESILDVALATSNRMVEVLVECGVDLEAKDSNGQTALLRVVKMHNGALRVKTLITHGADIHAKDIAGQTVLYHLHSSTDDSLQRLLELGVDVNNKDARGATPLDFAVRQEDDTKLELLLRFGGIPGEKDTEGQTVLHHLRSSTDDSLQRLLELGIDVNARDNSGATPLDFALRQSDNVKYKVLFRLGGIHGEKSAPLAEAADLGNTELTYFLLQIGADPSLLESSSSKSALSLAASKRNKEIVIALLKAGADPNLLDGSGFSPLAEAMARQDREIGKLLIEAGAVVQPPNGTPYSPVIIAIRTGDVSLVKFLIRHGANLSLFDSDNLSVWPGHRYMSEYLTGLGVPFRIISDDDDD